MPRPARPSKALEPEIARKLDGGLRRLLRLSDQDVVDAVERDRARIKQRRVEIDRMFVVPRGSPDEDRGAVRRMLQQARRSLRPHPVFGPVIIDPRHPPRIRALLRFTGNRDDLAALGIKVGSQAHDVFTISGTSEQLAGLAALPATLRLRLPRLLEFQVEEAAGQAEIDLVRLGRPAVPGGLTGNGVIVGVIDSPLDVTHNGFRDPAAPHNSRVLYYWVQYTPYFEPPGLTPDQFHATNLMPVPDFSNPTPLDYGRIYTGSDVDIALGRAGGPYGEARSQIACVPGSAEHGTHVAGIACGSGHTGDWTDVPVHIGAAPGARIVHVKTNGGFPGMDYDAGFEDNVLDALDLIFRAADFHGMPTVVNVSLGTSLGPHNGTESFDIARDNMLNSFDNRVICWPSGNENMDHGFRRGTVAAGGGTDTIIFTPFTDGAGGDCFLDVWYSGPELDFQVSCGAAASGWVASGSDYLGTLNGYDVEVDRDAEAGVGLRNLRFLFESARSSDPFTIDLCNPAAAGDVVYHAWTGPQGWQASLDGHTIDEMTICDTGCAKSILTVGACAKRMGVNPSAGENVTGYSGAGPTLDGRIKPEIACIGGLRENAVYSANSDQASGYTLKYGTSLASPLVAGAVALIFEELAGLATPLAANHDTIKALLVRHAHSRGLVFDPAAPGYHPYYRNQYGHGRLRLASLVDHLAAPREVDLWIRTAEDDWGTEPYLGDRFWRAPDIRVYQTGTMTEVRELAWGTTYDVRVRVRNLGDGDANNAIVRLKYTRPHAAPTTWHDAEDAADRALANHRVSVPALGDTDVLFRWRPEAAEIGAPAGTTHICLLAEVGHRDDPLAYAAPTTPGRSAWELNIKGTNNIALRNVFIA